MKNGITLLGEPGKFTLKYGDKKLGTAVEQNGVFVLNFVPERTTADSDNILSLGPWEHRDDIDYTDDTVPREGVVPTSSTTAAAVMLTFDDQGLNDVENSQEYMTAVVGWGDTTNMPTDDGVWGTDAPDETTWGETPAERTTRLLTEAEQVLAPGEYMDVEVRVPPPNLTRYVSPAFNQIRSDGHQLLLSFFANAEYYLRAYGHKATAETWHKRLGHPSQSTQNNTIKAAVLDKNSLLLPNGLELTPVNRPAPCTICPAANLPHEPFLTHFPGADDYQLMDKVYSDILNLPEDGFNGERYVITFTDASTRYYRPPTAPLGKFDQRAKWGLHLDIEKQYFAWRIMDYRSRLLVPARDCIFYENLTLPVFEQHLASQQNPAMLFHGVRSFANADVEITASEEPDSDGAREAAPDPPVPVTSSGILEFIPLADAAHEDVRESYPAASRRGPDLAARHGLCPAAARRGPALPCRPAAALPCRRPVAALRCRRRIAALPFSRPSRGPALPPPSSAPALPSRTAPLLRAATPSRAALPGPEPRRPTEPRRPAEPCRPTEPHCPARAALAATAVSAATTATAATVAMASLTVLTFDVEGRAVDFDVWVDDLQLFLQCDSEDEVSLFDHTSGLSHVRAATADSTVRSQWTTRDAVARLAVRSHLPSAERMHFGQYKTAKSLYDAVVARYSSPANAALSRLMLPYLFSDLAAFATVTDLITHLRTSDARYRAALPTEFCAKKPPPPPPHVHHPLLPRNSPP
ncbi:unnamed protein product [Closterium sp. NIES-54]